MKTVNYLEQEFRVPDWATHIAADIDGEVFVYDSKPDGVDIFHGPERYELVGNLYISTYPVKAL